jgi:rRNA maturation endonuclease Nob1
VKLCEWSRADEDTDMWETGCDNAFVLNEGTPSANKFKFCPYCGGTLRTARKDRKR